MISNEGSVFIIICLMLVIITDLQKAFANYIFGPTILIIVQTIFIMMLLEGIYLKIKK